MARAEFRHVDLEDRFIMWGNLAFVLVRSWGVAVFGLMLAAIPLWVLFYFLSKPLKLVFGVSPLDLPDEWLIGLYFGASIPIAIYFTWLRWKQLEMNRMVIDAQGIEYLWYPRKMKRIPWSQVKRVRDTEDPDDTDSYCQLVFETAQGKITILSEFWPLGSIYKEVQRYFTVTMDFPRKN